MSYLTALTRDVSDGFAECELTHLARQPIDVARARAQHGAYEHALEQLGCSVRRIAASADMPDSVFIEDTAIVLDEVAIITRPGAVSRRVEVPAVSSALAPYRPLVHITAPGTVDGGDVLVVRRSVFVGLSGRTNQAGFEQMRDALKPFGYIVSRAWVHGCLHLKSAISALDDHTLLANRRWIDVGHFGAFDSAGHSRAFDIIDVDPSEPTAANIVRVSARLLYAAGFPKTLERLRGAGYEVLCVDVSEIAKAEGAVTCCSLIFADRPS